MLKNHYIWWRTETSGPYLEFAGRLPDRDDYYMSWLSMGGPRRTIEYWYTIDEIPSHVLNASYEGQFSL